MLLKSTSRGIRACSDGKPSSLGRAPAAMAEGPLAPWGVQLSGNFSKSITLASFGRARQAYASILGEGRPMIIGTRLRSRGLRPFYRVRVPVPTGAPTRFATVSARLGVVASFSLRKGSEPTVVPAFVTRGQGIGAALRRSLSSG